MGRRPRFRGHDYCELQDVWGIPRASEAGNGMDPDEYDLASIRNYITSSYIWADNRLPWDVKSDMIKFINALLKTQLSGYDPVYKAMKKLDDFAFMQVFCTMLPHMWT